MCLCCCCGSLFPEKSHSAIPSISYQFLFSMADVEVGAMVSFDGGFKFVSCWFHSPPVWCVDGGWSSYSVVVIILVISPLFSHKKKKKKWSDMFTHAYSFTIHLIKRIFIFLKGWKIHIRIFGLLFQRFFFKTIQNKKRSHTLEHTHEVSSYVLKEMRLDLGGGGGLA